MLKQSISAKLHAPIENFFCTTKINIPTLTPKWYSFHFSCKINNSALKCILVTVIFRDSSNLIQITNMWKYYGTDIVISSYCAHFGTSVQFIYRYSNNAKLPSKAGISYNPFYWYSIFSKYNGEIFFILFLSIKIQRVYMSYCLVCQ